MTASEKIPVPAQHGLGPHHQSQPMQDVAGQPVQQHSQEGPTERGEPHALTVELALQDGEVVAQGEDLGVFGAVAHVQQPQPRNA